MEGGVSVEGKENPSVKEIREFYEKNKNSREKYEKAKEAFKTFRDVTKSKNNVTVTAINKDTLRNYYSSIGSNESNFRKVARYLYYRSNILYRIVNFYADMWDLRCRKVIPPYDLVKEPDANSYMKSYNDTLEVLDRMNLQGNMTEILINIYLEDVFYGIRFMDETGMFVLKVDPDDAIIDGRYMTGDFSFAIDMSKYRSASKQALVEFLGPPLSDMYKEYERTGNKWIHCPDEYAVCFKFRTDLWDLAISPMAPLLIQLTNLEDNIDQQAAADNLSIFKLVYIPMKTLSKATESDDFEISPDITLDYFDKLVSSDTSPYINWAVVPGDELKTIDFTDSVDKDVNRVEAASNQILATAGGGAVLNSNMITSTAAFNAWLKEETEFALSTLMPQINGFCNRILSYEVSNPAKVEHFEISIYTKEEFRKAMLESCQYSYANRIAYNTLLGISERDTLSELYLENTILGLPNKMQFPLASSYTSTGEVGEGRPSLDDDEPISDSGERNRNYAKTKGRKK